MKDRLLKFLNTEKLSATKFADEIGVQRSSISHILSGRNKPSYDFIYKTLNKYENINAEWLINGKGNMYKESLGSREKEVTEQKLFNNNKIEHEIDKNIKEKTEGSTGELEDTGKAEEKDNNKSTRDEKSVEKVMIFFSDGKFREYSPE